MNIVDIAVYGIAGACAIACFFASMKQFGQGNNGAGVGLLVLTPITFVVGIFLGIVIVALAIIALACWLLPYMME